MTIYESNATPAINLDLPDKMKQSMDSVLIQTVSPKSIT